MRARSVALFPSSFSPHLGGVEELTLQLGVALRDRGNPAVVITNRWPRSLPASESIHGLDVFRERFRFPEPKPRHLAGWVVGTRTTRRNIERILTRHDSCIIHVQCVSTNGYYALRAARRLSLPLVVSLHGELSMDASQIYQRSPTLVKSWRALLSAADVVTGCSQQVIDEAVDVYGPALASKARVVRNGVHVARIAAVQPEVRQRPYIIGAGRLVPQKGFDLLIEGFLLAAHRHPTMELVIAGDGPERSNLERVAARSSFAHRITFTGRLGREQMYRLYRGSSCFVLSSRYEPQGMVVLEAMAAGSPVLAAQVGGVPETITHEVNGLLFPAGSAAQLANGLDRILTQPEQSLRRAVRARFDVERNDWQQVTNAYEACYRDATQVHSTVGG